MNAKAIGAIGLTRARIYQMHYWPPGLYWPLYGGSKGESEAGTVPRCEVVPLAASRSTCFLVYPVHSTKAPPLFRFLSRLVRSSLICIN